MLGGGNVATLLGLDLLAISPGSGILAFQRIQSFETVRLQKRISIRKNTAVLWCLVRSRWPMKCQTALFHYLTVP
jgi:hypothetical protein